MAQLLVLGTNFVNFVGFNACLGGDGEVSAVTVTEWEEPQAVIGSYLHRYAYPDMLSQRTSAAAAGCRSAARHGAGRVGCLQLRGEYLYVAEGAGGMRVYDVAGVANKGISQRIITAPLLAAWATTRASPADNATCVALPTNQPIAPDRERRATRCGRATRSSRSTRSTTTPTSPMPRRA